MLDAVRGALAMLPWEHQAIHVNLVEVDDPIIVAVRVWPRPAMATWWSRHAGRWAPSGFLLPGSVLAHPERQDDTEDGWELRLPWSTPLQDLLALIPEPFRLAVEPLPAIAGWRCLVWASRSREALDLVRRHPVLMGLVAFRAPDAHDAMSPYEKVREHLGGGPACLLGLLGLPEEPLLVAFLDAMQPEALRELGDDGVMELLHEQIRRWF